MAFVMLFLIYKRSEFVSRRVHLFLGKPLSSREAADPNEVGETSKPGKSAVESTESARSIATGAENTGESLTPPDKEKNTEEKPAALALDVKKLEVSFWEIPHDLIAGLITNAEEVGGGNEGQVFLIRDGTEIAKSIPANFSNLGASTPSHSTALQPGGNVLIQTAPSAVEQFQFLLKVQINKWENKEAAIHWQSILDLPQSETAQELASDIPVAKPIMPSSHEGTASLQPASILLFVVEPGNRRPREEYIRKAGTGPWSIFSSERFHNKISDWVILIQLK